MTGRIVTLSKYLHSYMDSTRVQFYSSTYLVAKSKLKRDALLGETLVGPARKKQAWSIPVYFLLEAAARMDMNATIVTHFRIQHKLYQIQLRIVSEETNLLITETIWVVWVHFNEKTGHYTSEELRRLVQALTLRILSGAILLNGARSIVVSRCPSQLFDETD